MPLIYEDDVVWVVTPGAKTQAPVICFRAEQELIELMNMTAIKIGVSRSELIRRAVEKYLEHLGVTGA